MLLRVALNTFFDYINRIGFFEMVWRFLLLFGAASAYVIESDIPGSLCGADICLTHRYEETQCVFGNLTVAYRYRGNLGVCTTLTLARIAETIETVSLTYMDSGIRVEYGDGFRDFNIVNVTSASVFNNMMVFGVAKTWTTEMLDAHILVYANFTESAEAKRIDTFNPNKAFINRNDQFGFTVDVGKYFVVVGAPARKEIQSATPRLGAVFLYQTSTLIANSPYELLAPGRPNDQPYGLQVMTVENRVFVGWNTALVVFQCTTVSVACVVEKRITANRFARAVDYFVIGSSIFHLDNLRKELIQIFELQDKVVDHMNQSAVLYKDRLLLACPPGYTGVQACIACEENFYAPHIYAEECLPCPDGFVSSVAAVSCRRPETPIFIDRSWGTVAYTVTIMLVSGSFLIVLSSCFFASCFPPRARTIYQLSGL